MSPCDCRQSPVPPPEKTALPGVRIDIATPLFIVIRHGTILYRDLDAPGSCNNSARMCVSGVAGAWQPLSRTPPRRRSYWINSELSASGSFADSIEVAVGFAQHATSCGGLAGLS